MSTPVTERTQGADLILDHPLHALTLFDLEKPNLAR